MLQTRDVDISQFIKITAGGVQIADYDQVQAALIRRYKEVYGSDIDLANTTADGIFVNDLALIINNILQTFKAVYANLDIETASGVYLDTLCKLSNVTRKNATRSIAQLQISSNVATTLANNTIFVDTTGNEWTYNGQDIAIVANAEPIIITVQCNEYGAIEATAGSIIQTLEMSSLNVVQATDASVGQEDESDADLRARRAQSNGAQGVTVLESLVGALLELDGVDDAQIINNNTDDAKLQSDGTTVPAHSVYVILRTRQNLQLSNDIIGNIIAEKLTPGIPSTEFTGSNGESKSYLSKLDPNISYLDSTIYWKDATPINPSCTVTIIKSNFYADTTSDLIKNAVIEYLNNVNLSAKPTVNDMLITATYADPTFRGAGTYVVSNVTVPSGDNPNTYYNYTDADIVTSTTTTTNDTLTFTFR